MELFPRPRVNLNDFLPHVMAMVSGDSRAPLSPNVAVSYIRRAAIRFATDSAVLVRTENVALQDGLDRYPLTFDADNEIPYALLSVKRGYCDVEASLVDDVIALGCPVGDNRNVVVKFSVIPTHNACNVDSLLMDRYHDAIVSGALEQIHLMPQKPWTSGAASERHGAIFLKAVADARKKRYQDADGNRPRTVAVNPRYSLR